MPTYKIHPDLLSAPNYRQSKSKYRCSSCKFFDPDYRMPEYPNENTDGCDHPDHIIYNNVESNGVCDDYKMYKG